MGERKLNGQVLHPVRGRVSRLSGYDHHDLTFQPHPMWERLEGHISCRLFLANSTPILLSIE